MLRSMSVGKGGPTKTDNSIAEGNTVRESGSAPVQVKTPETVIKPKTPSRRYPERIRKKPQHLDL